MGSSTFYHVEPLPPAAIACRHGQLPRVERRLYREVRRGPVPVHRIASTPLTASLVGISIGAVMTNGGA
jgi:hypothetical protein